MRQNLKFFVAQGEPDGAGARPDSPTCGPLQFAFESRALHAAGAARHAQRQGPQDLVVYALTKNGRVETTNYRTVKLPANVELPTYTRAEFGKFYKALFETPVEARGLPRRMDRVFLGHGLVRSMRRRSAFSRGA